MLIGRKQETKLLEDALNSDNPEFVAIYGRRRVGKTYLVDETYKDNIVFRHTGLPKDNQKEHSEDSDLAIQLNNFYYSLLRSGFKNAKKPGDWLGAFFQLEQFINEFNEDKKIVIFIDEIAWMDTKKSYFIEALSNFWNSYCSLKKNVVLVVCASATSWVLDNVIHSRGGLYNRITNSIRLLPFSLKECEDFFKAKGANFSRYDIAQIYMTVGGIPLYLNHFNSAFSIGQNIDRLFFNKNAILSDEYDFLFSSQFNNPRRCKAIIEFLSKKGSGFTADEIANELKISTGGTLSKILKSLSDSGFIMDYKPFGEIGKIKRIKLIDPFCLFYLKYVKEFGNERNNFWSNFTSQKISNWRGTAFENLCFNHVNQIKRLLDIGGVESEESLLIKRGDNNTAGAQIDLIINRKDNIVNMCEAKFYNADFIVDKDYYFNVINKDNAIKEKVSKQKSISNVLVTTYALKKNEYSNIFNWVITLDDLFE